MNEVNKEFNRVAGISQGIASERSERAIPG